MNERNANWFAVEAKSFEITVDGEVKKTKYVITERSRGKVSWIRFGEEGLSNLRRNVDEYRNAFIPAGRSVVWRENGRLYRLERQENQNGRFLLCSAKDVEGKKHRLFFPEGRGFVNGWALLAEKLTGAGLKRQEEIPWTINKAVPTKEEEKERIGPGKVKNPGGELPVIKAWGEDKRRVDNAVWADVGDCGSGKEIELLQWSLIGTWKIKAEYIDEENMFENLFREAWRLNKGLRVAPLNEDLLLLEFESVGEAKRVLESGRRNFRGGILQLERWDPYSGCIRRKGSAQVEWVRVVGLPLHLWKTEVLKRIGDACGGYLAIDKITELRRELSWARMLVKTTGLPRPSTVNILEGPRSFELQIWWEVRPWVTDVYPVFATGSAQSPKEEDDGEARAEERVGLDCRSCIVDSQREETGQLDTGGQRQTGPDKAEGGKFGAVQTIKRRGGDKGRWAKVIGGASGVGGGLIQRAVSGPTNGAGGPKFGPEMGPERRSEPGPKTGPEWRSNPQTASRGWGKVGQQFGAHNKACLANLYENDKSSKARNQKSGSAFSTDQKDTRSSEGETKCDVEGDRQGVKGSSPSDAMVDHAWICAGGSLRVEHEERLGLKDCYRFEYCEKAGLGEMSSELPVFTSPSQGFSEKGYPNSQALEIVECGIRCSEEEVAEDFRRRSCGSRYETESPSISSSLCSVFGWSLLYGGPSGCLEDEELGDLAPLRVMTADGMEWGEKTSEEFSDAIIVTESCGDGEEEGAETRTECLGYEKWEDSCLIKFSEFLGIPTVGFDAEILELLRKMVS